MLEAIPGDARLLTYAELGELLGIEPESAKRRAVRHGWRRVPGNEGRTLVVVPRTAIPESPPVPRTPAKPEVPVHPAVPETPTRPEVPDPPFVPGDMPDRPGDTERTAVAALEAAFAASRQDIEALRLELRASEEGRAEAEGRAAVLAAQVEAEQQTSDARTHNLAKALARERERADRAEAVAAVVPELRERVGRAEGESATLRERMESERARAAVAEAELEKARIGRAAAEAGMKGLQEALAEARRPWWRKALGR